MKVDGLVTTNVTGEPAVGVVVIDKNDRTKGTITDPDGKFSIQVDRNATLEFSCLGYETMEIAVQGRSIINVEMAESTVELETVVVVGVAMRKSDLTGAVSNISNEKLNELPVITVNEALQGRIAGVYVSKNPTPGSNATISIRGNNSIQYGTEPIYVVDGIVVNEGFNLINTEDVASIEVLKDASATSLYGSRASNGVIVITTKKGQRGGRVSYDGWVGFSDYTRKMELMNTNELYDLRIDAGANSYIFRQGNNPEEYPLTREQYIQRVTATDNYDLFADYEHDAYHKNLSYNWLDEVIRKGVEQNHSVSFSDADDKGNYYLSLNYSKQTGLVKTSDYERFSGKINLDRSLKPWLKVGTNTSYIRGIANVAESSIFGNAMRANPFYAINDEDVYMKWGPEVQTGVNNPLKSMTVDEDRTQNRLLSANYININPIEGLNIRNTFSIDFRDQQEYYYAPKNTGQSIRNSYDGNAIHTKNHWFNWQYDGSVAYDTNIDKHRISAMATVNISKNVHQVNRVDAKGFASDDFLYYYLNGATLKNIFTLSSDFTRRSIAAFVQRVNYTYDYRYYATVTIREEGSSSFAPENRWGTFPSVALAWNAANESFLKGNDLFDQLKLRLGYGIVGNQNIPLYAIYSLYRPSVTNNSVVFNSDGRLGNPDLRWEKQKQWNVGLDAGILNNRLSFTADYYYIKNTDLLMQRSLSPISGYNNRIDNVGELENKGFEFTVSGAIIDTRDLKWNVSGNISFNRNKITKLYGDVDAIWNRGGYTTVEISRTGNLFLDESINNIYVYKFDRIAQESDMDYIRSLDLADRIVEPGDILPKDINNDKRIDDNDRFVVGSTDPEFFGGASTDVSYKGLRLNAIFNYSYGGKRISGLYETLMSGNGVNPSHVDLKNRWTPQNTNTTIPRAFKDGGRFGYSDVDWGVQDASFLRMSAITLSYDFPNVPLDKLGLQNLQLYCTGNNLLTITSYKGYDPEGGDSYPSSKMYVLGLKIGF
ncbi:MAG: TonB-dependent receptor [Tannerella sp.]|nr:TonB-dependent receptor [Tannerella sp.]